VKHVGDDFLEAQKKGCELVCEALQLNGYNPKDAMGISWNVFMNLFRQHHKNPTYNNFHGLVEAFMQSAEDQWDEGLS
jgi:hypothetical protein